MTSTLHLSKAWRHYSAIVLAVAVVCSSLLLAGCGKSSTPTSLPALEPDAVILAFGDSITYGTGAQRKQSYPARLAELTARTVINAGVPGETTEGGLKRLAGVIEQAQPDLIILCLGGNDFLRRHARDQTRQNLVTMIRLIKSQNIPVILMAVPELGLGIAGPLKSAGMYQELSEQFNIPLQNSILAEVLADRDLKADAIHPNAAGYTRIAEALQALMRERGALPYQRAD